MTLLTQELNYSPKSKLIAPIAMSLPGAPAKGTYQGPGAPEWILGFLCTALLATQIKSLTEPIDPQTALSYYFANPHVRTFHGLAILIDALIVICIAGWIFAWRRSTLWQTAIAILAFAGIALVWIELILAIKIPARNYTLSGLPFNPINNAGLIGGGAFLGYLSLMVPTGELGLAAKIGQKLAVFVGVVGIQLMLFEQVARSLA